MLEEALEFTNLFAAALLAGALFAVWLLFDPHSLGAADYVVVHQQGVRALNVKLPLLGLFTTVLTAAAAVLFRADRTRLVLLAGAALCFVAGGIITRAFNQPINTLVMGWREGALPTDWTVLRDAWWRWHLARFAATLTGLGLLIGATLRARG